MNASNIYEAAVAELIYPILRKGTTAIYSNGIIRYYSLTSDKNEISAV